MQLSSLGGEDPLEKGMKTCSSILAWRIPMDRGAWRATKGCKELDMTEVTSHHLKNGFEINPFQSSIY